ncbi:MAG: hypothetical protein ACYTX0_56080 [Nostoc sp.]
MPNAVSKRLVNSEERRLAKTAGIALFSSLDWVGAIAEQVKIQILVMKASLALT